MLFAKGTLEMMVEDPIQLFLEQYAIFIFIGFFALVFGGIWLLKTTGPLSKLLTQYQTPDKPDFSRKFRSSVQLDGRDYKNTRVKIASEGIYMRSSGKVLLVPWSKCSEIYLVENKILGMKVDQHYIDIECEDTHIQMNITWSRELILQNGYLKEEQPEST